MFVVVTCYMNDINNTNRYLQLNEDFINAQEFLVADIRMDGERHFLLATEYQLGLLREAKRWYMDGTFKVNHYILFVSFCCTSISYC